jgi:hypothetical protein
MKSVRLGGKMANPNPIYKTRVSPIRLYRRNIICLILVGLLFLTFLASATPVNAFHRLVLNISVTRVENLLKKCFDPLVVGCSRPDYYAVVTVEGDSKENAVVCLDTRKQYVQDRDTITPSDWNCEVKMEKPTITVQIFDYDGSGLAAIDGADKADISSDPREEDLRFSVGGGTTVPFDLGWDTRVTVVVTATREPSLLRPVSVNRSDIDPTLNENITLSGSVDHRAQIKMRINGSLGGGDIADFTSHGAYAFAWNGTYLGGQQVALDPLASWSIIVHAEGGPLLTPTWPFIISGIKVFKRPPNTLTSLRRFPAGDWNPRAGPLTFDFSVSSAASVTLTAGKGTSCTTATAVRVIRANNLPMGVSSLSWDGREDPTVSNMFVPAGDYVIELSASFASGAPSVRCFRVKVIDPPPLELVAEHSEIVGIVGESMTFMATAIDASVIDGSSSLPTTVDRLTWDIQIWVADSSQVSARRPPTAPAMRCRQQAVCTVTPPNLTGSAGRIAYKATAVDLEGTTVETPWRLVDIVDRSSLGSNVFVMAGVASDTRSGPPQESFGIVRRDKTIDMVFTPGNFVMSSDSSGPNLFRGVVADHIRQFWGLGPKKRFPSSFLRNQENLSFWVNLRSVTVNQSNPSNPSSPDNLCSYGAPTPPWADLVAVVHRTPCRDNANPFYRIYSANDPPVSWHEAHHGIAGLADEYCNKQPDCDGGYFQTNPFPNLYFWPADCQNDPLASMGAGTCRSIRPGGSAIPGQSTRWWRLDPDTDTVLDNTPDVMIRHEDGIEFGADVRRVNYVFDQCDQGKCGTP